MERKLACCVVAAAIGAVLLVAAAAATPDKSVASKGQAKKGGTYVVTRDEDFDFVDPSLDYMTAGWELQYALACKLYNYPDKEAPAGSQLEPEVAAGLPVVSNGGKTYTMKLRSGYRFSDGTKVTAASFVDAFNRAANPKLVSPAVGFIDVVQGVGAVVDGKAQKISGVTATTPMSLRITLTRPAPDLLARLAMPFFQAIPKSLAANADPNGAEVFSSCGPYYVAAHTRDKSITVKRNPFYKGARPSNVDVIQFNIGSSLEVAQQDVESGRADLAGTGVPPTSYATLAAKYGVNKGRLFVKPELAVSYLAMNHDRPLFKNNPQLAKAVNWAIDRRALLGQGGFLAGKRSDQILPPGLESGKDEAIYPLEVTARTAAKAKALAAGHTGDGKAVLWTSNRPASLLQAQIMQYNLKQIGLDVSVQAFSRGVQIEKTGTRGAEFDLTPESWGADYADPYDFINILLSGDTIASSNNQNVAYFNSPKYNRQMREASSLRGNARTAAYHKLDMDITRNDPAWAVRANSNARIFVSARTDCFTYQPVYLFDYAAVCLR